MKINMKKMLQKSHETEIKCRWYTRGYGSHCGAYLNEIMRCKKTLQILNFLENILINIPACFISTNYVPLTHTQEDRMR